jgi:plastocyanin
MSYRRNVTTVLSVIAIAALLVAGCSKNDKKDSSSSSSGKAATGNQVTIKNFEFGPKLLSVKAGTKVTFTNDDSATHTVSSVSGDPASFDSKNLKKGQSFSFTFTKAGTYAYQCDIHNYMKGTVTVK